MLNIAKALSEIKPLSEIDSYLNIMPPVNKKYIEEAKKLGFNNIMFNLEVFGEQKYKEVCPGKHNLIPHQIFIDRMIEAVNFFQPGNVRCGFVFGAQPVNELEAGVKYLAQKGVVSDYTVFTPKKGTPWQNKFQPDIIDVAKFSIFLVSIYKKYNFTPLYDRLSSRSSIMNECFESRV